MNPKDFCLRFASRAPHLMWLLGAGASASAGIKTAGQMIWDFKRRVYCLERSVSENRILSLDDSTKQQIQNALDKTEQYPEANSLDEYSFYFEKTWPSKADRSRYIQEEIRKGKPSRGHLILAALLRTGRTKLVWTTNFDPLVEQAYGDLGKIAGISGAELFVASLNNSDELRPALNESRFPIVSKLHGDYQSSKLMNTSEELRAQDDRMRKALTRSCGQFGLVVVGYSGRDASVMDALENALDDAENFPHGIFWICRLGEEPLPRVLSFIANAQAKGIEAAIVKVDTFDELMGDLLRTELELPSPLSNYLYSIQPAVSNLPLSFKKGGYPLLQLNALLLSEYPQVCRLIPTSETAGSDKDIQELILQSGNRVLARRFADEVLAFGGDADCRAAFTTHISDGLDIHKFVFVHSPSSYKPHAHRLVLDALVRSFVREGFVDAGRRFGNPVLIEKASDHPDRYAELRSAIGSDLSGAVNGIIWHEAVELHLEFRSGRMWLVLDPVVWIDSDNSPIFDGIQTNESAPRKLSPMYAGAREFARQRMRGRYNRAWGSILMGWINVILEDYKRATYNAFDQNLDGVNATFTLNRTTAYSFRDQ